MQMNPMRTAALLIAGTLLSCAASGYAEEKAGADPAVVRAFAGMNEYPKHRDGYLGISFKPTRPKAGDKVKIEVKVFNFGKKTAGKFNLALFDGKDKIGEKKISGLAPSASRTVKFQWTARNGFHCFVAKVEAEDDARADNNHFLRTLVVGDRRKARPYLFFRRDEIQAWKKRVEHGEKADKWFRNILTNVRSFANLEGSPDDYHEIRGLVAHSAAVMFTLEGDAGMRDKAVAILKSIGSKGKVYVSTKPGSWDDRQRICGIANYCMAYDLVAPTLSKADDRTIRALLAKEIKHHADVLTDAGVHQTYVGSFHYYTTGFAVSALALADYDDTEKGAPDYDGSGHSYGTGREWLNLGTGIKMYQASNEDNPPWIASDDWASTTGTNAKSLPTPTTVSPTALMFLLVRTGQPVDMFLCPSDGNAVKMVNVKFTGTDDKSYYYWDFYDDSAAAEHWNKVGYSCQSARYISVVAGNWTYKPGYTDNSGDGLAVMADKTPEFDGKMPRTDWSGPLTEDERKAGMSQNHNAGDFINVLFADAHVKGGKRADVGIDNDNIYSGAGSYDGGTQGPGGTHETHCRHEDDSFLVGPIK